MKLSNADIRTADEILDFMEDEVNNNGTISTKDRKGIKHLIHQALVAKMPSKKFVPDYTPQDKTPKGYNQALDEVNKIIGDFFA